MSNRVSIRLATVADAEEIVQIYSYFVRESSATFEVITPSTEEFANRIKTYTEIQSLPYLVCELIISQDSNDTVIVGYAYASNYKERFCYQWSKETSIYLHKDHHGKGIGTALYFALIELLQMQKVHNLIAGVSLPNTGSTTLHEKFGFVPCGVMNSVGYKFGKWHSVGYFERRLVPIDTDDSGNSSANSDDYPEAIIPLSELPSETINSVLTAAALKVKNY